MRIALLMNLNSYAGREYLDHLNIRKIKVEIISIGNYPERNEMEDIRCNNLWKPRLFDQLIKHLNHYHFSSLSDLGLVTFLRGKKYDICIQGGTGIIRENIIQSFRLGILNFHPGDLPKYRGCSSPEWQILENKPVVCTCHLIDEGIDTGKIYQKKELRLDFSSYHTMRATVYPEISKFMIEVLQGIIDHNGFISEPIIQNEKNAQYRKIIENDIIEILKKRLHNKEYRHVKNKK